MIVKLFQPRFASLVRERIKRQTVRPWPKRLPKVGEEFSGRQWSGLPYRSKQIELVRGVVAEVEKVTIGDTFFQEGCLGRYSDKLIRDAFAKDDGFANWEDLIAWFLETHELPFQGMLIRWE